MGQSTAIPKATELIRRHGHRVAWRKLKVSPSRERQEVTGLVVNRTLSVPKSYREQVRAEVIRLACAGSPTPRQLQSLMGKIAYVSSVSPNHGRKLYRLAADRLATASL